MTEKEKAKELIDKFIPPTKGFTPEMGHFDCIDQAKNCALIAVDEILKMDVFEYTGDWSNTIEYWQEIRNEINKL